LIEYTPRAIRQLGTLVQHYEDRHRPEAIRGLFAALDAAERTIEGNPSAGLAAPRAYPQVARKGRAWVKAGRYWVAYSTTLPPVIVAVFYETADIPRRM
jgi:plasmid stabilization system protein ParE